MATKEQQLKATTERRKTLGAERERRQLDALRLYRPMPVQDDFHRSNAKVRIIRKGNRAGGSVATMVETARAARGRDPYNKYPKEALVIWMVVYEEQNIGRTLFRMLFRPGLFKIIRDDTTGRWRSWNPLDPRDLAREAETRKSPPLIPVEEIEGGEPGMPVTKCPGFSWVKRGQRIFRLVRLKNGTQIYTMCSGSEPPMGDPIHLAVIDEDLKQDRMLVSELEARTSDYRGKIIWAVWPKSKNDALDGLSRLAEEQKGLTTRSVEEFRLEFLSNPYLPEEERRLTYDLWVAQDGELAAQSRNTGDSMIDMVRMFPEFDMNVHAVPNVMDPQCMDRQAFDENIDWFLRTRRIPPDWCRFLWIDPGLTWAAALFLACPPADLGDWIVAYDEIYLHNSTLEAFAQQVLKKRDNYHPLDGPQRFYAFGVDWHYTRRREWTTGKTVKSQMIEWFRSLGIRSESTGHGFHDGSDDVQGRIAKVRGWLAARRKEDGSYLAPKFRVLRAPDDDRHSTCRSLEMEFRKYMKQFSHDEATDDPVDKYNHLMDALQYAAHDPQTRYHLVRTRRQDPKSVGLAAMLASAGGEDGSKTHFHMGPGRVPVPQVNPFR